MVPPTLPESVYAEIGEKRQFEQTLAVHSARMINPVAGVPTPTPLNKMTNPMQKGLAVHYVTKIKDRFSEQPEVYLGTGLNS